MATTFLYFAFGSNLLKQRLLLKNPSARYVNNARLDNFRLTFDIPYPPENSSWKGAAATIREHPGECVWGTVWELDMADSDSLDRQEANYFRRQVYVTSQSDDVYVCRTYEMEGEFDISNEPSPQYKDVIVRGAKQSKLPLGYIEKLEAIQDNGFKGPVPLYESVLEGLQTQDK